jgi:thymidylate synthase ThyX
MSYKSQIIAHSKAPTGEELITFIVTYPRIVHAEMLRHRNFARNSASSRAIPFKKMVQMVEENPFVPLAFQRDHKGMQGTEYITSSDEIEPRINDWLDARNDAVKRAKYLNDMGVTKQLCNRLLEPFMWHTEIITGNREHYEVFFELRCPQYALPPQGEGEGVTYHKSKVDFVKNLTYLPSKVTTELEWLQINQSQADIHIQKIAEMMYDDLNKSKAVKLKEGQWHIPFGEDSRIRGNETIINTLDGSYDLIKIATARCARISYYTLGDNPKIDYEADIQLHDRLLVMDHWSCFEHCAKVMNKEEYESFIKGEVIKSKLNLGNEIHHSLKSSTGNRNDVLGWCRNFKGFINYRHLVEK